MIDPIQRAALRELGGRSYGRSGDSTTDCSRFVGAVLLDVFGGVVREHWADLMIMDGSRPWSDVDAIEAMGIGCVGELVPGRWHVVQGWRRLTRQGHVPEGGGINGHVWLWYEPATPEVGNAEIVQATPTKPPWCGPRDWALQIAPFKAGVRIAVLDIP